MKSPQTQLRILREIATTFEDAANAVRNRGDWLRYQLNVAQLFKSKFEATLLAWRIDDEGVTELRRECLDVAARSAKTTLEEVPMEHVLPDSFPYEKANLLLSLGAQSISLPVFPMHFNNVGSISEKQMKILLVQRLGRRPLSADWDHCIARLAKNKRARLSVETFTTYALIIESAESGNLQAAMQYARHASDLFLKRAKDKYFDGGGVSEGGGMANDLVVDYVLASIQSTYFSQTAPGAERHWWRW